MRRWMSKKYSFRRRWPVYLAMTLICVTSVAFVVLLLSDIDGLARTSGPQHGSVPKAMR